MDFSDVVNAKETELQANIAIPKYYEQYERAFGLPIIRPIRVTDVTEQNGRLINATGTWKTPHCPKYPGWENFKGRQLHTAQYKNAKEFIGKRVIVEGGGISAIQSLWEISAVTQTTWVVYYLISTLTHRYQIRLPHILRHCLNYLYPDRRHRQRNHRRHPLHLPVLGDFSGRFLYFHRSAFVPNPDHLDF
ncbi:hypothetical protein H9X96_00995 [Pedobacter sp. N36a]|nr:hypothetical protein [Pedobacter sp. N36a]